MKNIVKKIAYIIAVLSQLTLIIAVVILNSLTEKKAGVMRHVYFRRLQYEQGIFSPKSLAIQSNLSVILGIGFVLLLLIEIKRKRSRFLIIQSLLAASIGFILFFIIKSSFFIRLIAYPYFIIAFEIAFGIQMLILGITFFVKTKGAS